MNVLTQGAGTQGNDGTMIDGGVAILRGEGTHIRDGRAHFKGEGLLSEVGAEPPSPSL
jgi:hypothetical protein